MKYQVLLVFSFLLLACNSQAKLSSEEPETLNTKFHIETRMIALEPCDDKKSWAVSFQVSLIATTNEGNEVLVAQGTYSIPCGSLPKINSQKIKNGKQILDISKLKPYPLDEKLIEFEIKTIPQITKENSELNESINKEVNKMLKKYFDKEK